MSDIPILSQEEKVYKTVKIDPRLYPYAPEAEQHSVDKGRLSDGFKAGERSLWPLSGSNAHLRTSKNKKYI